MLSEKEINKECELIKKFVTEIVERMYEYIKDGKYPLTSDVQQLHEYVLQLDTYDFVLRGDEILKQYFHNSKL